jgi:hypothetical protein
MPIPVLKLAHNMTNTPIRRNGRILDASIHAEVAATMRLPTNPRRRIQWLNLVVIRVNPSGELRQSKPCQDCIVYMHTHIAEKGYRIRDVYYSDSTGRIIKERFSDMVAIRHTLYHTRGNRLTR